MPLTPKEKSFGVLEYSRTQSLKTVQCALNAKFGGAHIEHL